MATLTTLTTEIAAIVADIVEQDFNSREDAEVFFDVEIPEEKAALDHVFPIEEVPLFPNTANMLHADDEQKEDPEDNNVTTTTTTTTTTNQNAEDEYQPSESESDDDEEYDLNTVDKEEEFIEVDDEFVGWSKRQLKDQKASWHVRNEKKQELLKIVKCKHVKPLKCAQLVSTQLKDKKLQEDVNNASRIKFININGPHFGLFVVMLRWGRKLDYAVEKDGYYQTNGITKETPGCELVSNGGCCIGGYEYLPEVLANNIGEYLQPRKFVNGKIELSRNNVYFSARHYGACTRVWVANVAKEASIEFQENWGLEVAQRKYLDTSPNHNLERNVIKNFLDIVTIGKKGMQLLPQMLHRRNSLVSVMAKCMLGLENDKTLRKIFCRFKGKVKKNLPASIHLVDFFCCAFKKYASKQTINSIPKKKKMSLPRPWFGPYCRKTASMVRVNIPFYCHGTGKKEIFRHYFSLTVGDEPVTLPNGTIVDNAIMKECLFCETLLLNFEEAKTERYDNRIPANEPLPIPIKVMDYGGRVLHLVDYEEWSKQEENGACTINFCMLDDTRQYTDRWRKNKGPYKGYFYGWPINLTGHRHDQGSGHRKLTPFFKTLKKYHEYTLNFVREPVCDVSCLDDMKKPFMYIKKECPSRGNRKCPLPLKNRVDDIRQRYEHPEKVIIAEPQTYVYQLPIYKFERVGGSISVHMVHVNEKKHVIKDSEHCLHHEPHEYKAHMTSKFETISKAIKTQYHIQGNGKLCYPYECLDNRMRYLWPPYLIAFLCDVAIYTIDSNFNEIMDFVKLPNVYMSHMLINLAFYRKKWFHYGDQDLNKRQAEYDNTSVSEVEMRKIMFVDCQRPGGSLFNDIVSFDIHPLLRKNVEHHLNNSVFDDFSGSYFEFLLYIFRMIHERFDIFRAYRGKNTDFFYGSPDTRLVQFKHVKGGFFFLDRVEVVPKIPHVECHIMKRSRFNEAMVQQVIHCQLNDLNTTVTIILGPRLLQIRINDRIDTGYKEQLSWVRLQQIIYCVNDFKTRNNGAAMTAAVPHIDKNHYLFIENKIKNEEIIGRSIVNAPDSTAWNAIVPKWWHQRCVGAFRVDPLNPSSCDLYAYVLLACRGYDRPCHVEFCIDGENLVWDRTFNVTSYNREFALSSSISSSLKKVILDYWAVQGSSFALVRNAIAMVDDSYGSSSSSSSSSSSGSSSGSSSRPTKRQKTAEVEVVEVAHNTVDEVLRNKLKKAEEEGKVIYLS